MATSSDVSHSTATSCLTGYLSNVFLHGVLTVQLWEYYLDYPDDRLFMKLAVYTLYATETTQTVLIVYLAFVDLALNGETSFNAFGVSGVVLGSVVAFIFEMFYAFRIILLSRRRWLTGIIVLLASVQLGTGIWTGAVGLKDKAEPKCKLLPYNIRAYLAWFGVAALCDTTITTAMLALLVRNDSGLSTTRRLTKRVLKLTVESGAITTIATILCITLIASNAQLSFIPILQSLPKLYSNSLLVQLNSRSKPYEIDLGQLDPLDISFVKSNGGQSRPHHLEMEDGLEMHRLAAGVNLKDDEPPPDRSTTKADSATLEDSF